MAEQIGTPTVAALTEEQAAQLVTLDAQWWATFHAQYKGIDGQLRKGFNGEPGNDRLNILQMRVLEHYRKCQTLGKPCLIMILKPRQRGASTIAELVCFHHMRKHPNLNGSLMGDIAATSDKVFEMYRRYAENDDYPWPDGLGSLKSKDEENNQADAITLPNGSKWWKETAGSKNAGRGGTIQVFHGDETAYFTRDTGKDPLNAVLNSFNMDLPLALGFLTSTANGMSGDFYSMWMDKSNEWCKIFAAWFEFPECQRAFTSDAEREHFQRTMTEDEVQEQQLYNVTLEQLHWRRLTIKNRCKGDVGKFRQEYPSSEAGAFLSSSRLRFDAPALNNLLAVAKANDDRECGNLIFQGESKSSATWLPDRRGAVTRWEEPRLGCRYVVSVDTCSGRDQQTGGTTADPDYHSAQVWRAPYVSPDGVHQPAALAALHHSRDDTDVLAETVAAMATYYGKCLIVPEVNGMGGLHIVKQLVKMRQNVFRRDPHVARRKVQTEEEKLDAYGWATDAATKKYIIDQAAPMIRQEQVYIRAPEVLEEFLTFVIHSDGRCGAMSSKHDDHVIAACIALACMGGATEYRVGRAGAVDLMRLSRDRNYLCQPGWSRKAV